MTWHPPLTVYRLALITSTVTLGSAKALSSSPTSVTLDWIIGIAFFLLVFFLAYCDVDDNARPSWLFRMGVLDVSRMVLRGWSLPDAGGVAEPGQPVPIPRTRRHYGGPMVTGYRLAITVAAVVFGTTKLYLSFMGEDAAPRAIEWVYSVVVSLSLYWLGHYEHSPSAPAPWLFKADCAPLARATAKLTLGSSMMVLSLWGIRSLLVFLFEAVMAIDWVQVFLILFLLAMSVVAIFFPALLDWIDLFLRIVFLIVDRQVG